MNINYLEVRGEEWNLRLSIFFLFYELLMGFDEIIFIFIRVDVEVSFGNFFDR